MTQEQFELLIDLALIIRRMATSDERRGIDLRLEAMQAEAMRHEGNTDDTR